MDILGISHPMHTFNHKSWNFKSRQIRLSWKGSTSLKNICYLTFASFHRCFLHLQHKCLQRREIIQDSRHRFWYNSKLDRQFTKLDYYCCSARSEHCCVGNHSWRTLLYDEEKKDSERKTWSSPVSWTRGSDWDEITDSQWGAWDERKPRSSGNRYNDSFYTFELRLLKFLARK